MPKPNPNRPHRPGKGQPHHPEKGVGKVKPRREIAEFLRTELRALADAQVKKSLSRNAFLTIQWSNHLIDSMSNLSSHARQVAKRAGLQNCEALAEMAKGMGSSKRPTKMERVERLFKQAIVEIELLPELARGGIGPDELEFFQRQKESLHTTLGHLRDFKQPMVQMTRRQLESFGGLSLTVLKWSLGDKLFAEYLNKMTDMGERLQVEP
jgi:hypothetical protein